MVLNMVYKNMVQKPSYFPSNIIQTKGKEKIDLTVTRGTNS